jgi:hypothetical protein
MTRSAALLIVLVLGSVWIASGSDPSPVQVRERVGAILPPPTPLPSEAASSAVTRFSFIAYGDTRGRQDGTAIPYRTNRASLQDPQ